MCISSPRRPPRSDHTLEVEDPRGYSRLVWGSESGGCVLAGEGEWSGPRDPPPLRDLMAGSSKSTQQPATPPPAAPPNFPPYKPLPQFVTSMVAPPSPAGCSGT